MAFFGKIFGTVAGFATGGPMGALLGAALGHAADKKTLLNPPPGGWAEQWKRKVSPDFMGAASYIAVKMAVNTGKKDQALALCMIILSAKIARCDGPVNRKEIDAFKRFFIVPPQQQEAVGKLFDQARVRTDDYYKFAEELAIAFKDEKNKLENLLILLFTIARADQEPSTALHTQEEKILRHIHKIFELPPSAWEYAFNGGNPRSVTNEPNPYEALGIHSDATDEEIRNQWRKLVREHHPDVMAAKGASKKQMADSAIQIVKINAAWDYIKRNRGL
ncbi:MULTISPECIES: TerB family tellurite resistance protein [Commensalibacter]|uniref:DnaJ-like protein n=2 Tax=Commensalibacter TaxID=1079922 RepID=W7DVT4_9PROT|nr:MULTISPECIES: TerB family tellurite resistance protein [Commensalibacter]EUK19140.1 DnaJ-like protein [Commensalibacter papalotli (ex Servin-Garciduenas et al. 2014)]CAI3930093.1 DnaJ domain-containing protein (DjlA) (PUBMED:15489435 [Commensalibacter papalotli (ex Botero et al. 2024)]CAI3948532.1 DnaJ domain-containing protein (DjlA) (PUBMED:15489435 [Commensalibacter papalotli (ex Botero et al. 2024)]